MKITEVPIAKLKPYEKNAKKHPASQVKAIARSIEAFGFNVPLVIDAKHRIWSGHGRLEAAKLLNLETLPCVKREDLTDEQLKAYSLADNKLNESDWDMETVMEELKQMSLEMIDLTGFDSDLVLETKEDDFDLANIGEPTAKLGDLYQLGESQNNLWRLGRLCDVRKAPERGETSPRLYRRAVFHKLRIGLGLLVSKREIRRHWRPHFQRRQDARGGVGILQKSSEPTPRILKRRCDDILVVRIAPP
jgi:hypothetical protein